MLRTITPDAIAAAAPAPIDAETLTAARSIFEDIRTQGQPALRRLASRFDALPGDAPLVLDRPALDAALETINPDTRALLERTADRIRAFAQAQKACLQPLDLPVPGGRAGHTIEPMQTAGCYAPGGRYPLPSSVLMTAIPARVAGVETVVVATPSRDPVMLAAAAIAGADLLLNCGGAHAVAALATGAAVPACDIIVGPGNRWVTAAKHIASAACAIDMLAGPSELLIIADHTADPALIAADLLAQAEHDEHACAQLITTDASLIPRVNAELESQLATLSTAAVARKAIESNGWACVASSLEEAARLADAAAPEHLEILTESPETVAANLRHAGALFIGPRTAEVFGDYGLGPNHTLPTGRTARARGGLSVLDFLRVRTWINLDTPDPQTLADTIALARTEHLEAHARSAERRLNG
ncbi:MAG: histidinol dehydrogenase [Planctomycetota bacterium]|nr:MAG: histidinol dehydrogenase [Planctomycetota bacterium]